MKKYKKLTPERRKEILEILMKEYPKAFFKKERKALKVGVHNDLLERMTRSQIPVEDLKGFLGWYTSQNDYLHSVVNDTHRIDLDGNEVKEVSEADKHQAKSFLKWRAKKSKEQKAIQKKQDKEEKV